MKHASRLWIIPAICVLTVTAVAQDIRVENSAKYSSGRYSWTIYLTGSDATLNKVDYVQYTLHPSFPQPIQIVRTRGGRCAFPYSSNSWAEFEVKIKVVFKDGRTEELKYMLNLMKNANTGTACTSRPPAARAVRRIPR
jgi:transcription initiation factor IIF auxiliary subunit